MEEWHPQTRTIQTAGLQLVPTYKKGDRGTYRLVVSEKGWKTLKRGLKAVTKQTTPNTLDERIQEAERDSSGLD